MLLSPGKNSLDSLFKEVRVFKGLEIYLYSPPSKKSLSVIDLDTTVLLGLFVSSNFQGVCCLVTLLWESWRGQDTLSAQCSNSEILKHYLYKLEERK